ncbi:hypothetical protein HZB69_04375 [Candidatus Amesbacteria bacterium]|nr:hypothetical protein [Candidatus Amesbacteria bacterium]
MQKIITKFYFDRAKYLIGDDFGNEAILKIDYKNSRFTISKTNPLFKQKVTLVAKRLIVKKHNINFSDRIEI